MKDDENCWFDESQSSFELFKKKKKNSNLRVSVFLTNDPSQSKILCVLNKLFIAQHLCPREDNGCQALIMSLLQLINTS